MRNRIAATGLGLALLAAACGGQQGGPVHTGGPSGTSVSPSAAGAISVTARPRGCHRTRRGEVDIKFDFALAGSGGLGAYDGETDFHATLTSPAAWTTVPGRPLLIDKPNTGIFHVIVPDGEPIPATLTLHVRAVAVDERDPAVASSLKALEGQSVPTSFGDASIEAVSVSGGTVTISVRLPSTGLPKGATSLGPGSAVLAVGGHQAPGSVTPMREGTVSVSFALPSGASGETTLTLADWTFDVQAEAVLTVPVAVCNSG